MGLGSVLALEGYIFSVILINHLNWDFKNENINAVCCFKPQIFMLPFSTLGFSPHASASLHFPLLRK